MPKICNYSQEKMERKKAPVSEYDWLSSGDLALSAGLEKFYCNIRFLEKGKISYPYHYHHNAEEIFVIIEGKAKLRTKQGLQDIGKGDIILFEKGESGAHQICNDNDNPLIYLDLRSRDSIDICEYPDTGKVNILPQGDVFYRGDKAGYFDNENRISDIWNRLLK